MTSQTFGGQSPAPQNAPEAAPSAVGVQPGQQFGIVLARIIIISSSGGVATGLFVYNGVPSAGNPPIFAVVAPGVTADPFGNPVKTLLNAGNLSGAHFGLDDSGNVFLADSTGATRIYLSPGNVELAFYTTGGAAVLMSMAPAGLTDPLTGDTIQPGFNVYGQGSAAGKRVQMSLDPNGNPIFIAVTGESDEQAPAQWGTTVFNAGLPNQFLYTQIVGPANSNQADVAWILLQSSTDNGVGFAGGNLMYTSVAAAETPLLLWGEGGIFATNIADQQHYDIQRRTLFAVGQAVNSVTNVNISGLASSLAAGQTYRFHSKVMLQCTSAATPILEFTGPALGSLELDWRMEAVLNSGASNADSFTFRTVSVLGGITGTAMATTSLWTVYIDGQITPSAAGTLQMVTRTGGSGNFNILAGSYMDIMPVTILFARSKTVGFSPFVTATNGLALLTGGGTITSAQVASIQAAGYPGAYLHPLWPWSMAGLVLKDVTNFIFKSDMGGSIGYSGNIATPVNTVSLGNGADGIQIYSDAVTPCQGIKFDGLAFTGQNSNSLIHYGGRERGMTMRDCFALNNLAAATTFTGTTGTLLSSFTGTQSLGVSSTANFPTAGTVIVRTTNAGFPGLGLLTYNGVTANTSLNNVTLAQGVGASTLTQTTSTVQVIAAALIIDTALGSTNPNAEDHYFNNCYLASQGGGFAVGIGVNTPTQNANDCAWDRITTASPGSSCSLCIFSGGGHNFRNYYDRTGTGSTLIATTWNDGGTIIFRGGEDVNNNTTTPGVTHLVDASAARTFIHGRNVDLPTGGTNILTCTAGGIVCRGVTRIQGTANVQGGILDLGDCAGQFGSGTACAVVGTSGTLILASAYASGSAPTDTGFTGTIDSTITGI